MARATQPSITEGSAAVSVTPADLPAAPHDVGAAQAGAPVPAGVAAVAREIVARRLAQLLVVLLCLVILAQGICLALVLGRRPAVVYLPDADLVRSIEVP